MKVNNFLHLVGGACLFLQGCETLHFNNNDKETSNLNEKSTLITSTTEEVEQTIPVHELEPTTQLSKQNFRAQPRRPIVVEKQSEEAVEDRSETDTKASAYTVQKGDTLYKIAKNFNVTVAQLVRVNNLSDKNRLSIGMELVIPNESDNSSINKTDIYVVQKGDTLTSIANRFQTTIAALKQNNKLSKDTIYVGQKLYVNGVTEAQSSLQESSSSFSQIDTEKYVVKAGDALYNIAKRCGMTVQELIQINNIQDPKALQIGQVLYLKKSTSIDPVLHTESTSSASQVESQPEVISTDSTSVPQNTSIIEEDNFEDLFEEGNDIPVIPLEDIK